MVFILESNGTLTHSASITYECAWRQTWRRPFDSTAGYRWRLGKT